MFMSSRTGKSGNSTPKLTLEQARKYLNPEYKEQYHRLALIENDMSEKVLTYEFGGAINGSKYRIYLNADNGNEEVVEQIRDGHAKKTSVKSKNGPD